MKRALLVACAVVFCVFVWPTPYRYDHLGQEIVKTNRITAALGLDDRTGKGPTDFSWTVPAGVYVLLGFGLGGIVGYVMARRRLPARSATPVLVTAASLALAGLAAIAMRYKVTYPPNLTYGVRLDRWTGATEGVPVVIEELGPAKQPLIPPPPDGSGIVVNPTWPPPPPDGSSVIAVAPSPKPPPGFVSEKSLTAPPGSRKGAVAPYSDLPPGYVIVSTPAPPRARKKQSADEFLDAPAPPRKTPSNTPR